jgi:hypothetical protein
MARLLKSCVKAVPVLTIDTCPKPLQKMIVKKNNDTILLIVVGVFMRSVSLLVLVFRASKVTALRY